MIYPITILGLYLLWTKIEDIKGSLEGHKIDYGDELKQLLDKADQIIDQLKRQNGNLRGFY